MGQEIEAALFTPDDFVEHAEQLRKETALLGEWFASAAFSPRDRMGGYELEAWLVDSQSRPLPINDIFLKKVYHLLCVCFVECYFIAVA